LVVGGLMLGALWLVVDAWWLVLGTLWLVVSGGAWCLILGT